MKRLLVSVKGDSGEYSERKRRAVEKASVFLGDTCIRNRILLEIGMLKVLVKSQGRNEERVIGHWRKSYAYYKVTEHLAKLCYTVWNKNKICKH